MWSSTFTENYEGQDIKNFLNIVKHQPSNEIANESQYYMYKH